MIYGPWLGTVLQLLSLMLHSLSLELVEPLKPRFISVMLLLEDTHRPGAIAGKEAIIAGKEQL